MRVYVYLTLLLLLVACIVCRTTPVTSDAAATGIVPLGMAAQPPTPACVDGLAVEALQNVFDENMFDMLEDFGCEDGTTMDQILGGCKVEFTVIVSRKDQELAARIAKACVIEAPVVGETGFEIDMDEWGEHGCLEMYPDKGSIADWLQGALTSALVNVEFAELNAYFTQRGIWKFVYVNDTLVCVKKTLGKAVAAKAKAAEPAVCAKRKASPAPAPAPVMGGMDAAALQQMMAAAVAAAMASHKQQLDEANAKIAKLTSDADAKAAAAAAAEKAKAEAAEKAAAEAARKRKAEAAAAAAATTIKIKRSKKKAAAAAKEVVNDGLLPQAVELSVGVISALPMAMEGLFDGTTANSGIAAFKKDAYAMVYGSASHESAHTSASLIVGATEGTDEFKKMFVDSNGLVEKAAIKVVRKAALNGGLKTVTVFAKTMDVAAYGRGENGKWALLKRCNQTPIDKGGEGMIKSTYAVGDVGAWKVRVVFVVGGAMMAPVVSSGDVAAFWARYIDQNITTTMAMQVRRFDRAKNYAEVFAYEGVQGNTHDVVMDVIGHGNEAGTCTTVLRLNAASVAPADVYAIDGVAEKATVSLDAANGDTKQSCRVEMRGYGIDNGDDGFEVAFSHAQGMAIAKKETCSFEGGMQAASFMVVLVRALTTNPEMANLENAKEILEAWGTAAPQPQKLEMMVCSTAQFPALGEGAVVVAPCGLVVQSKMALYEDVAAAIQKLENMATHRQYNVFDFLRHRGANNIERARTLLFEVYNDVKRAVVNALGQQLALAVHVRRMYENRELDFGKAYGEAIKEHVDTGRTATISMRAVGGDAFKVPITLKRGCINVTVTALINNDTKEISCDGTKFVAALDLVCGGKQNDGDAIKDAAKELASVADTAAAMAKDIESHDLEMVALRQIIDGTQNAVEPGEYTQTIHDACVATAEKNAHLFGNKATNVVLMLLSPPKAPAAQPPAKGVEPPQAAAQAAMEVEVPEKPKQKQPPQAAAKAYIDYAHELVMGKFDDLGTKPLKEYSHEDDDSMDAGSMVWGLFGEKVYKAYAQAEEEWTNGSVGLIDELCDMIRGADELGDSVHVSTYNDVCGEALERASLVAGAFVGAYSAGYDDDDGVLSVRLPVAKNTAASMRAAGMAFNDNGLIVPAMVEDRSGIETAMLRVSIDAEFVSETYDADDSDKEQEIAEDYRRAYETKQLGGCTVGKDKVVALYRVQMANGECVLVMLPPSLNMLDMTTKWGKHTKEELDATAHDHEGVGDGLARAPYNAVERAKAKAVVVTKNIVQATMTDAVGAGGLLALLDGTLARQLVDEKVAKTARGRLQALRHAGNKMFDAVKGKAGHKLPTDKVAFTVMMAFNGGGERIEKPQCVLSNDADWKKWNVPNMLSVLGRLFCAVWDAIKADATMRGDMHPAMIMHIAMLELMLIMRPRTAHSHSQSEDPDGDVCVLATVPAIVREVCVGACHTQADYAQRQKVYKNNYSQIVFAPHPDYDDTVWFAEYLESCIADVAFNLSQDLVCGAITNTAFKSKTALRWQAGNACIDPRQPQGGVVHNTAMLPSRPIARDTMLAIAQNAELMHYVGADETSAATTDRYFAIPNNIVGALTNADNEQRTQLGKEYKKDLNKVIALTCPNDNLNVLSMASSGCMYTSRSMGRVRVQVGSKVERTPSEFETRM